MLSVVPPKPNLLFNMAFTFRSLATWGTRSTPAQFSLGLSRFSVGGTIWSRIANMQNMDSTAPAPPSKWQMADLVEDMERLRSEENTSELQSLMRNSYAVVCLKKKKTIST